MKALPQKVILPVGAVWATLAFAANSSGQMHWYHGSVNDSWPDSLKVVTLMGTVLVDSSAFHFQYFLDVDGDGEEDYRLMFGPWWYRPESEAVLPSNSAAVSITGAEGYLMDGQSSQSIMVFEINGQKWREPILVGGHGWQHDHFWESGQDTITVTGNVLTDSSYFYPGYFLDVDGDSIPEYKLDLGPGWYEPIEGTPRPRNGNQATIFGRRHPVGMGLKMIAVYDINGLPWRPATGPAPWAGTWMNREQGDSLYVFCVNDSSSRLAFAPGQMRHGGMGMGGMQWPDSVFVQFWSIYPDSLPGQHHTGRFMGYYVDIHDPQGESMMGGSSWGGEVWGGHHGRMEFENDQRVILHYSDEDLTRRHVDETTIQVKYWDPSSQLWMGEPNSTIDTSSNTITIIGNTLNTYYALYAGPVTTSVDTAAGTVSEFELLGNYPNPFNPETTITFRLSRGGAVRLEIYNVLGQKLVTLVNDIYGPGLHRTAWMGLDGYGNELASGVYLVVLDFDGKQIGERMTLMR